MELNSIYTLQHFAMGTKEQKARMTRRLTSEMQSWPELTGNGDTLFGCSPWLNYTTLITNLVRRRFSKGVAFRSSCSRQWEASAAIPYLLLHRTPPSTRLSTNSPQNTADISSRCKRGKGRATSHPAAPDPHCHPSAHSSIYQPAHLLFSQYQLQKATLHATQFEPTRKTKQPIHCQI